MYVRAYSLPRVDDISPGPILSAGKREKFGDRYCDSWYPPVGNASSRQGMQEKKEEKSRWFCRLKRNVINNNNCRYVFTQCGPLLRLPPSAQKDGQSFVLVCSVFEGLCVATVRLSSPTKPRSNEETTSLSFSFSVEEIKRDGVFVVLQILRIWLDRANFLSMIEGMVAWQA